MNVVENVLSSYETRVHNVGTIFDTSYELFDGIQDSLLDTKSEREEIKE